MDADAFQENMTSARAHEYRVAAQLIGAGWDVHAYGMGVLPDRLRLALRGLPVRHDPDWLAWTGRHAVYVDAKDSRPERYATVQSAAVDYQAELSRITGLAVFYVFANGWVVDAVTFAAHSTPGRQTGNGSGTPFYSCPLDYAMPFGDVFGTPRT